MYGWCGMGRIGSIAGPVVVELAPGLLVVGVLRMCVWDSVVHAHPLVSVVVLPHAVVEHGPAFLYEVGEVACSAVVLVVLGAVVHEEDDLLAEDGALDGGTAVVQQVALVLLDGLLDAVLQDLLRRGVLQTERTLHHLVAALQLGSREPVLEAALGGGTSCWFLGNNQRRSFTT